VQVVSQSRSAKQIIFAMSYIGLIGTICLFMAGLSVVRMHLAHCFKLAPLGSGALPGRKELG
jgi:hypothetical protein